MSLIKHYTVLVLVLVISNHYSDLIVQFNSKKSYQKFS
jgi:hypothetical protein